ncbi:hypothetical protein EVJ58_g381 [Rhodofomes roseus]|uniref:WD40 repeat protein n=1 Tax=Rhodofomes roseus TaxID=34475 RepID=A0A4Y9Z6J9_9APHY|nr:hypothetical protein EVJ58_g381 [Rhodofomes roseus]
MTIRPDVMEPVSQEDDSNFRMSLQITMEKLVGDAVGNMSISPSSRDVVLATRNGLFIIDLEAPLNVPRFLPQGGTWDVADVQWNPHLSRSEYIVSTSSEKLLIWNLYMTGKTSIEHVLRSHYRAITDINWHNTEPDVVVSTGIDSWLWAWDLRAAQKPVMGLCAFGSGGTQTLVYDVRPLRFAQKGSLPVSRIRAHTAKIYGIDWVHGRSNEILTCSLDKSIKLWDTQDVQQDGGHVPKLNIHTAYPVWRARDLPFGRGLLSLPQRSETALEMYAYDDPHIPVDVFQGHADVVKEITSVINKLSTSKVKLEDARDLTKKRKCTFGLHGPWGEGTSVFIRTTFTFPRDYPQASYPNGIPRVDMDRTPLIDMPTRAFILRRLRAIREKERPCLEKCLRFLLFGDDEKRDGRRNGIDSESSSDEDMPPSTRRNRGTSFSLLRTDKNLAEPRTSQGVFGPNGQLVCFFPAPPRIVKNAMREISVSPSLASRGPDTAPRLFQSPALLSDAVRRLTDAAQDRASTTKANNQADDAGNILRIMTNLFTYSQLKSRRVSEHSRPVEDIPASYSLLPQRRSSVLIKDTAGLVGIDAVMASEYTFAVDNPADCCKENADIAKARGRIDHERIMRILEAVFTQGMKSGHAGHVSHSTITRDHRVLAVRVLTKLYQELSQNKDIQMLAMLSALLLRTTASPQDLIVSYVVTDIALPDARRTSSVLSHFVTGFLVESVQH